MQSGTFTIQPMHFVFQPHCFHRPALHPCYQHAIAFTAMARRPCPGRSLSQYSSYCWRTEKVLRRLAQQPSHGPAETHISLLLSSSEWLLNWLLSNSYFLTSSTTASHQGHCNDILFFFLLPSGDIPHSTQSLCCLSSWSGSICLPSAPES